MEILSDNTNITQFATVTMIVFAVLFLIFGIAALMIDHKLIGITVIFILLALGLLLPAIFIKEETTYKIRIKPEVTFGELEEKYEIIEYIQDDNTYIVKEREGN